jgi:hypothetical protein
MLFIIKWLLIYVGKYYSDECFGILFAVTMQSRKGILSANLQAILFYNLLA